MNTELARHTERPTSDGGTLYLMRPDLVWRLDRYELKPQVYCDGLGQRYFLGTESFLEEWREKEFMSEDQAVAFFNKHIATRVNCR
jgi:hypothetical protein